MTFTCAGFAFIVASFTCTAPDPVPSAARFCKTMTRPVLYSRSDTAETRRQLRALNGKWRAVCGGR